MRIPTLFAVPAFVAAVFSVPAVADPTLASSPAAMQTEAISPEACLAGAKGMQLAQINCCKGHKGVCGCRAGKIVCCDNTASTEPGCTCHADDGFMQ